MSTGFVVEVVVLEGIPLPGNESLKATTLVVPSKLPSGRGGRLMLFQAKPADAGEVVVV